MQVSAILPAMANRFARRIREGEIPSPEALASEFRALAKATHPDLAGPGADPAEFVRVRSEYEAALRDFERHRFGARAATRSEGLPRDAGICDEEPAGDLVEEAWASLALLLKRGFPKTPRHDKERLRYEYARWRFERRLNAFGAGAASRFAAFEPALLVLRATEPERALFVLGLLSEILEYRRSRVEALRTSIAHDLEALRRSDLDPALAAFIEPLVGTRLG